MINISGYITDFDEDIVDTRNSIAVNSCGYYKLVKREHFITSRPNGRADYQLIYISKGSAKFNISNTLISIPEGSLIIYHPYQTQYYEYALSESPEIYWLHFSGTSVIQYLKDMKCVDGLYFNVGIKSEYSSLFDKIIRELQVKRQNYFGLCGLYLLELLSLMSRNMQESSLDIHVRNEQIQHIIQLINKEFSNQQSIKAYAKLCNISTCWFIHSFKNHTGLTPQQYITDIRINKAKELLLYSSFNITEIASIVGYENPFYFSRIFKKSTGLSPREYKSNV